MMILRRVVPSLVASWPSQSVLLRRQLLSNNAGVDQPDLVKCEMRNDSQVALLTLNDPSRLNALTEAMGERLGQHIEQLSRESGLRAVVLTGEGRAFSAGGDLSFLLARAADTPGSHLII